MATGLRSCRRGWKGQGRLRYLGITTSHGRLHDEMLDGIERQPAFDFVQFSYNIQQREAEERLLPAAAARGKAALINRPFRTGKLFELVEGKPLPDWAPEIGCTAWSQFFLKFVVSHPAVTCAIPATSSVEHMRENMAALHGPMPTRASAGAWWIPRAGCPLARAGRLAQPPQNMRLPSNGSFFRP
jgi:aryl-alcohol dehydrogenase-like predicted oxidoreductase